LTKFDECKKEIEDARENMCKIELLEQNAENNIYEYFEDVKRKVDIRREELRLKIDNYSDEIIKSVETNQKTLIKLSNEVNQMTTQIEKSKNELNKLTTQFDNLKTYDKKLKDFKESVIFVNEEFHKILAEYQKSLIGNTDYTFEFEELQIEDIFGRVFDSRVSLIIIIFFNLNDFHMFSFDF
jgi:DNA repair ATPase RecN